MCFCGFSRVPAPLLTFIASGFPDHSSLGMHGVEGTTHTLFEFCSNFGDHLELFCIFGCDVEDSSFSVNFLQSDLFFIPGSYRVV